MFKPNLAQYLKAAGNYTHSTHRPAPAMLDHPAFQGAPQLGQFAKHGAWESAWAWERDRPPSPAALQTYLAGATEVAFEAFFGPAFFGVRLQAEAPKIEALAQACVSALHTSIDGPHFFFALIGEATGFHDLGRLIAFLEVGAVNAWRTVGSVRAGAPSLALAQLDVLWQALADSPLARDASHRKAVELAVASPLPHWFALPVSSQQPPYELDRDLLREALRFAAKTDAVPHSGVRTSAQP
ncbi:hypothetical protein FVQ98_13670 [Ottowia sp. GY511]|uniref:Uncharacterized protein n=1 Tax=Ottowia flava TaxID=2675430 RepID=A0ABW4KT28_9BURK|nr:hypothetical protein [Ottowia sp. GY511]TXK26670.1 hypothetical protein FVQ98_13670 [Ottowia sp. GY511]